MGNQGQTAFDFYQGPLPPSVPAVRKRRDSGIKKAADHASKATESDWPRDALEFLKRYLDRTGEPFLAEQFVLWALAQGISAPPDGRAWGSPIARARKLGLILRVGTGMAKTSNLSPKPLWQRAERKES